MSYHGKNAIPGVDFNDRAMETCVFDRERLLEFDADTLNKIMKRNIESAYFGSFWSFQVCNSIAARLVRLKELNTAVA